MSAIPTRFARTGALGLVAAAALSACGSSSKPAYCTKVTDFKNSVTQLSNISSPTAVVTDVQKVVSTGEAALTAVKGSFANETAAVKSSLTTLEHSVKQLANSGTRAQAIVAIPAQAQAVATAAENLAKAAKSGKCS
ncbi:MAG: hypothetical protein WBQ18_01810 [Solirubrobacteraceae bacterium]|jgi:hypothetical protein